MALLPAPRSSFSIVRLAISGPGGLRTDVVGILSVVDSFDFSGLPNSTCENMHLNVIRRNREKGKSRFFHTY